MKRSGLLITVLLSLFMFQSVWNVAAAFCLHQSEPNAEVINHFGHHLDEKSLQVEKVKQQSTLKFIQYLEQIDHDDHRDHLPSLAHVFLSEHDAEVHLDVSIWSIGDQYSKWENTYKSPHLNTLKQPPILTPLLVG